MSEKRPEKKSETLEVRLPHSKKEAFMEACERDGITASHAMRSFIDAYLKRSHRVQLKQIIQDTTMTLIKNPAKTTGGLLALTLGTFAFLASPSTAQLDRDAEPIENPTWVVYPTPMLEAGIGANCEAKFDVSKDGVPIDIHVTCSHDGFVQSTFAATERLRFAPKLIDGEPTIRQGVVYPYQYCFNDDTCASLNASAES